jgi:hypothetical protein
VRDVAAELLAEHGRNRRTALEAHGIRVTALRRAGTAAEVKTLRLIRARLDEHDEQTCRHVLAVLAADWLRDDSQFKPRDWTCEDAIWSTNFDRHRVREVGSSFGGKRPDAAKPRRFEDSLARVPAPKPEPKLAAKPPPGPVASESEWG